MELEYLLNDDTLLFHIPGRDASDKKKAQESRVTQYLNGHIMLSGFEANVLQLEADASHRDRVVRETVL